MRINYDFHIHSALSPCADDDMTPCNIVAMASVKGLEAIALSDHNSIGNVRACMECGEAFGVTVIPAVEVQTAEEIHVLALFPEFELLEKFYTTLVFPTLKNDPEIFGNQWIIDSDNEKTGVEERFLLSGATEGIYEICTRIVGMGGKAIPAHIDRDANGILSILGEVPIDLPFSALEFSPHAGEDLKRKYAVHRFLVDSDAHHLTDISDIGNTLWTEKNDLQQVFSAI